MRDEPFAPRSADWFGYDGATCDTTGGQYSHGNARGALRFVARRSTVHAQPPQRADTAPAPQWSGACAVTIAELEQWRELALAGMEAGLKARTSDPLEARLNDAVRRVGELSMENEILRKERELQARRPLTGRRSST